MKGTEGQRRPVVDTLAGELLRLGLPRLTLLLGGWVARLTA